MLDAQDDFRALFEGAPDLMYRHDLTGALSRVNRAFERVTGFARQEVLGRSFFDLLAPAYRAEAQERIFAHLSGDAAAPFPLTMVAKTGEIIQLEVSIDLVFQDGKPAAVQGYARDVTTVVTFTRYLQLLHRLSSTNYGNLDELFDAYLRTGCEIFGVESAVITSADGRTVKAFGEAFEDRHAPAIWLSGQTVVIAGKDGEQGLYLGSPCLFCLQSFGKIPWHAGAADVTAARPRTLPVLQAAPPRA